ncbi:uncharacterized protein LOC141908758 isoform X2 [Tubulanus polymorphus]|uniref:uncharacterized protein LOC141908758 isoform X2 n=1 Tax=Tubulanus polymorphus TaxID=672921 RepID=UPI003DA399C8
MLLLDGVEIYISKSKLENCLQRLQRGVDSGGCDISSSPRSIKPKRKSTPATADIPRETLGNKRQKQTTNHHHESPSIPKIHVGDKDTSCIGSESDVSSQYQFNEQIALNRVDEISSQDIKIEPEDENDVLIISRDREQDDCNFYVQDSEELNQDSQKIRNLENSLNFDTTKSGLKFEQYFSNVDVNRTSFMTNNSQVNAVCSRMNTAVCRTSHRCSICGKEFSFQSNLSRHMSSHPGFSPFACKFEYCTKSFRSIGNLESHLVRVHGYRYGTAELQVLLKSMYQNHQPNVT